MEKKQFNIDDTNDVDALSNFMEWAGNYQDLNLMTKEQLIDRVIYLEGQIQTLMD